MGQRLHGLDKSNEATRLKMLPLMHQTFAVVVDSQTDSADVAGCKTSAEILDAMLFVQVGGQAMEGRKVAVTLPTLMGEWLYRTWCSGTTRSAEL